MKIYPRIIFIGSTSFAIPSVKILLNNKYNIINIITNYDKNNNKKINSKSELEKCSIENNIKIIKTKNINDKYFIRKLQKINPDIIIVVSFKKISKYILKIPSLCSFNLHASFLPEYRGAAPIQWAIINGEKITGVTTFLLNDFIDKGKILLQERVKIRPEDTYLSLFKKLSEKGANLVIKTLEGIIKKKIIPKNQIIINNIKKAPKLFHKDGKINWHNSIDTIHNKIRGLNVYPVAWTYLINKKNKKVILKIYLSSILYIKHNEIIGKIFLKKKEIKISVIGGFLYIIEAQLEGKKKMKVDNFINGFKKENFKILI